MSHLCMKLTMTGVRVEVSRRLEQVTMVVQTFFVIAIGQLKQTVHFLVCLFTHTIHTVRLFIGWLICEHH